MALPDVSFTNNVGTVTFLRSLIDVTDDWTWDGQTVTHRKHVTVDAQVTRANAEALEGVVTRFDGSEPVGQRGTLTVPWTTLSNMKLESIDQVPGGWQNMCQVSASFVDDVPNNNLYKIHLLGFELENPRLTLPVPAKPTFDYYAQILTNAPGPVAASNPFFGPIRFRMGYGMMTISVGGSLQLPNGKLPDGIVEILQQRVGVGDSLAIDIANLPNGYPYVFPLGEAIPEISNDLAMTGVFVTGGRVIWDIERQVAKIQLSMMTQPQAWGET